MNTLEADSVIIEFGTKRVLSDVFIKCQTDEVIGLLGRNGSGKTTLLRIIFGELRTFNKSVRINNQVYHELYKTPGLISYLPQFHFIPKHITVRQAFKRFHAAFDDFGMLFPEFVRLYKNKFINISGGERRIIELFLILTSKTMFCLLDEPFTHVMPVNIDRIKQLIDREKRNKGIIIIDHLYEHILEISDRIYLIEQGKTNLLKSKDDLCRFGYVS